MTNSVDQDQTPQNGSTLFALSSEVPTRHDNYKNYANTIYNELKRLAKHVTTCETGGEAQARTIGIVSLSHSMQKSSHAAVDWFPISTVECIGVMLNPKINAGALGLVSEKYDDQIRSAANMESQSAAASGLIGCKESYSQ